MLHLIRAHCGKAVEILWNSFSQYTFTLTTWSEDGGIQWTKESFLDDVRSLLVNSEDNDDEYEDEPEVEESGPDKD